MNIISKHLQKLLEQKETTLWSGYVNMLKTLESAFASPKHWILEFLQNAEDATADVISIRLGENLLSILNNGNVFDEDDFYSICDVNSRKQPSLGFRGYIGIGFKSIFRITDRIDVYSGNFHFKFDREYWDDSKRNGIPQSKWPWEILPVEIKPAQIERNYKTCFVIPFENIKGKEALGVIDKFLAGNEFPKEAILLLNNIKTIEVQTPALSFTVRKKILESELHTYATGEKVTREVVAVSKQGAQPWHNEESLYLTFRKSVEIQDDVRRDSETERTRRSDFKEREVGIVFLMDSQYSIQTMYGKLAGVYSFLPVEGEQTGLPFGIFGDFIPQIGRDLVNYGAKWNHWMCERIAEFFKQIVIETFLTHAQWKFFPSELLNNIEYSLAPEPGKEFWDAKLLGPIKEFLEHGPVHFDDEGQPNRVEDLISVSDDIEDIVDKGILTEILGKKIAHLEVKKKLSSKINEFGIYDILHKKEVLDTLKNDKQKLSKIYNQIEKLNNYYISGRAKRDTPLPSVEFALGEDGILYAPSQVVALQMDLSVVPSFLKVVVPTDKTLLHPEIAKDDKAVEQLERCGMEIINEKTITRIIQRLVNSITNSGKCPSSWRYPDDVIHATLFLISKGEYTIDWIIAEDDSLQSPGNTFVSKVFLDWEPLYKSNLLPGYFPIHHKYFTDTEEYRVKIEKVHQFLENIGSHGFRVDKDDSLIEKAAYAISKKRLEDEDHHKIEEVQEKKKLGYDLECKGHCTKVFEVKGMGEAHDVPLEPSEVNRAQQKERDYILVCVYNLPNDPNNVGYKAITNPQTIWKAVEKAVIPKKKWLTV
jgi:hypothetical protein